VRKALEDGLRKILSKIYKWRVQGFIREGKLGYRKDWWRHEWIPQGQGWVDPVKEIQAALLGNDAGFFTLAEVLASQGKDLEEHLDELERENKMLEARGLKKMHSTLTRDELQQIADAEEEDEALTDNERRKKEKERDEASRT
jgi:capsid protein